MEQESDSGLNAGVPGARARVEGDRLDENNGLILERTPERRFVEGDTIVWERDDGTRRELYVEGISEHGDVQVILKIEGQADDRARFADFRLRFRDETVAYPVIPERAKEILDALAVE